MSHWSKHAQNWARIGPPLRPSPADIAFVAVPDHPVDVLVLGVTPELVTLPYAPGSTLVAVDKEPAMIDLLFVPGPSRRAIVGEWLALPLADASIDLALGDGCMTIFTDAAVYHAFAAELARVVRPRGTLSLRLFASPPVLEPLSAVTPGTSFDALKWRIAMAIQQPGSRNVRVADIRDAFDARFPDRDALATATGWSREKIDYIDAYRGASAVYSYPTVGEVRAIFAPHFAELACHVPTYELGDRCPTLVLARR